MTVEPHTTPPWLATVLLAEDDTEDSVPGSDWHQQAILYAYGPLSDYAEDRQAAQAEPWYLSSQVTVIVQLPRRTRPWQPKPDLFVVVGVPAINRNSYDTRREGPMPQFVLEVASESTWDSDVLDKQDLYMLTGVQEYVVFDPTGEFLPERVRAWHATENGWQPWEPVFDAEGPAVWRSAVLGLALRVEGPLLRFDHPTKGALPTLPEMMRQWRTLEQARLAAEAAEQDRQAVERRAEISEQERQALRDL